MQHILKFFSAVAVTHTYVVNTTSCIYRLGLLIPGMRLETLGQNELCSLPLLVVRSLVFVATATHERGS